MAFKIGDTVRITRAKSVEHLKAGGLSVVGKIVEVDPKHAEGREVRQNAIEFDDRSGKWWYANWEIEHV